MSEQSKARRKRQPLPPHPSAAARTKKKRKPAPYFDWTEEKIEQFERATGNGPIAFTRPGPSFDAPATPKNWSQRKEAIHADRCRTGGRSVQP
jgi:hypothetical protein